MANLKVLRRRAGLLATQLGIDKVIFKAAIDLLDKQKIPKPEKVFKDSVLKLNRKTKYQFLAIDMGLKKYFLMGAIFPMGIELAKKLEDARKNLNKTTKPADKEVWEQIEFFYAQMNQLKVKGFATGTMKFSKEVLDENGKVKEHLMAPKTSTIKVKGTVKKDKLAPFVRDLGYELKSKLGEVVYIGANDDTVEETTTEQKVSQEPQTSPLPAPFGALNAQLMGIESAFKADPSLDNLKAFSFEVNKLKEATEKDPTTGTPILQKWAKRFSQAKALYAPKKDSTLPQKESKPKIDPLVELKQRLDELEERITFLQKEGNIPSIFSQAMTQCQEIKVTTAYKAIFSSDKSLLNRFKEIRKQLQTIIKGDDTALKRLKQEIANPELLTKAFQLDLDKLWSDFELKIELAEDFETIFSILTSEIEFKLKELQQQIQDKARSLLEANTLLELGGDKLTISKNMTVIRSGIMKLKDKTVEKVQAIKKTAEELARLEYKFLESNDVNERQDTYNQLDTLTNQLLKQSSSFPIFNS